MDELIARTLERFATVAQCIRGSWIGKVCAGLSVEFGRFWDYADLVLCSTVPSADLCTESIFDQESKYGLDHNTDLTDDQRIARIIDRAGMNGAGGPEWLQNAIQAAGFPLYVIENTAILAAETQFGDVQFSPVTQFATMPKRVDPSMVSGLLITSSPNKRGGRIVSPTAQFGSARFGTSQFGTPDTTKSYPQPAGWSAPTDPTQWNRVFFLSPFPDRLATADEVLILSTEQGIYLQKLVIQLKFLRNWCIAQIGQNVQRATDDGATRVLEDGTTIRSI